MSDKVENPNTSAGINNVPPEILIDIFDLLIPQGPHPFGRRYTDLVSLTHSAPYLRKVAIAAPSLWTHIDITDRRSSFEVAKACVERSSTLSLNVSVRLASRVAARLQGILALLEHVSTRTAAFQVNLFLPGDALLNKARTAFKAFKYPVLEEMDVDFRTKDSRDNPRWRVPSFSLPEDAPKLQSITLVDLAPTLPSNAVSSLTRLVLNAPSFNDLNWPIQRLWNVLGQVTALEYLEIRNRSQSGFSPSRPQQPRTVIPNLHQLVLRGFDSSALVHLLCNIDAPELSDVVLEIPGLSRSGNSGFGWNNVHVEYPFPSVSSLEILVSSRSIPAIHSQLPGFLTRLFPDVEELSMPLVGSSDILRGLIRSWESSEDGVQRYSRWPGLYHISITTREEACDRHCWDRVEIVGNFLTARSKMTLPPLEWVTLTLCDSVKKENAFSPMVQEMRRMLASRNALELFYTEISSGACGKYAAGRSMFDSH
ncbi:hypothetical protein FRC04_008425 [Tulasnella sp. 424]|nr:hypothetical protein FRC04_008425 [Tulasnella sp. 424]KAG8976796.1 hypothetical protein FRC05_003146 [Tulasnella sp. 425]